MVSHEVIADTWYQGWTRYHDQVDLQSRFMHLYWPHVYYPLLGCTFFAKTSGRFDVDIQRIKSIYLWDRPIR